MLLQRGAAGGVRGRGAGGVCSGAVQVQVQVQEVQWCVQVPRQECREVAAQQQCRPVQRQVQRQQCDQQQQPQCRSGHHISYTLYTQCFTTRAYYFAHTSSPPWPEVVLALAPASCQMLR